ncbi:FAD assembly factor SdhE [Ferrimonas marina]|uniref:FAD assembly factor SdhE n=1 Tax=Ferrimonas marina TaxID=299255 RepID=A0A1M5ZGI6_9GAMM|nr:succinate dehydrogenase assembly factor 2 [Ferrimonas marina]SHI23251.1 antitoxin CptB [Ferrimonas marina]
MQSETHEVVKRLKWACRRGMLELDVLLEPFVEREYSGLSAKQQADFERLLRCDDPELFAWFMGHEACPDADLAAMVALILERNRP